MITIFSAIINANGTIQKQSRSNVLQVSHLTPGVYSLDYSALNLSSPPSLLVQIYDQSYVGTVDVPLLGSVNVFTNSITTLVEKQWISINKLSSNNGDCPFCIYILGF